MRIEWRDRAFSTTDAAELAGMRRQALDTWLFRHPHQFSQRRGGRRWFSPRDVAALKTAASLNRALPLSAAMAAAALHLGEPPNVDDFLVVTGGEIIRTQSDDAARLAVEAGALVVPIGRIASTAMAACETLYRQA